MRDAKCLGSWRARWLARAGAWLSCAVFALLGCGDRPSKDDCAKLLEKIVDLEVEAAGTSHLSPTMREDLEHQKKTLREELRGPFLEDCEKNMAVSVVACGLGAKSKSEFADCEE